jgi:hypothetical protein
VETQTALLQALENNQQQSVSEGLDFRKVLVKNTIAVLTRLPNKKGEWWERLRKLQKQAKEQHQPALAGYVNTLQRLVEGAKPETLTSGVPDEFKPDWGAILDGISKKE